MVRALTVFLCLLSVSASAQDGLRGHYYPNTSFDPDVTHCVGEPPPSYFTRVDPGVDFYWQGGPPAPGFCVDDFSVRWYGTLTPTESGPRLLSVYSNDGARLWIDGLLVVESWRSANERRGAVVELTAGQPVSVQLDMYEGAAYSGVGLFWARPGEDEAAIPADVLTPGEADLETRVGLAPVDTYIVEGRVRGGFAPYQSTDIATVVVYRLGDLSEPLVVPLEFGGDAEPFLDYDPPADSVTLAPGQAAQLVDIDQVDDLTFRGRRHLEISVGGSDAYEITAQRAAEIVILDNDEGPRDPLWTIAGTVEGVLPDEWVVVEARGVEHIAATRRGGGLFGLPPAAAGDYTLFAGVDEDGDGAIGEDERQVRGPSVTVGPHVLDVSMILPAPAEKPAGQPGTYPSPHVRDHRAPRAPVTEPHTPAPDPHEDDGSGAGAGQRPDVVEPAIHSSPGAAGCSVGHRSRTRGPLLFLLRWLAGCSDAGNENAATDTPGPGDVGDDPEEDAGVDARPDTQDPEDLGADIVPDSDPDAPDGEDALDVPEDIEDVDAQDAPDVNPDVDPGPCVSDLTQFESEVWRAVLRPRCVGCHNPRGVASQTNMVYAAADDSRSLLENLAVFRDIARYDYDGRPLVLQKPLGQADHGGGEVISEAFEPDLVAGFLEGVDRARSEPTVCDDDPVEDPEAFFDGAVLMGPRRTLRRAALALGGRLPTEEEDQFTREHGWAGFEVALGDLLRSEGFYARMREVWNDILLTDKYIGGYDAVSLLESEYYPDAWWFFDQVGGHDEDPIFLELAVDYTNASLTREPVEHAVFVLREGRPFRELLTADYVAMNPYTARVYGAEVGFDDPFDPTEFRAGRIHGIPHAGILTSPMFLNRYPTTETNRNRHRSRMVYRLFLGFDVFTLSEQPVDPTSLEHNPTLNDPNCNVCHAVIDPVAGAFQHWNAAGSYAFRDSWFESMRAPGFEGETIRFDERPASLRWLAERITATERFDVAMVSLMWQALFGRAPAASPEDGAEDYEAQLRVYESQQDFLRAVARQFRASNHDLRAVFRSLVKSAWYRAENYDGDDLETRRAELEELGIGLPLTPEQLNRKLTATTGLRWRPFPRSLDDLENPDQYRYYYGGIDSDTVTERIRTPNGIFANIQQRLAGEVTCRVTAYEFSQEPARRALLVGVTTTDPLGEPRDVEVEAELRATLVHLAWRLWARELSADHEEIDELVELFAAVQSEGLDAIQGGDASTALPWQCVGDRDLVYQTPLPGDHVTHDPNYTIRAWQAVLAVFFLDHAFLNE